MKYNVEELEQKWNGVKFDHMNSKTCCHFAAEAASAALNKPVLTDLFFSSEEEGERWLEERGYISIIDAVTDELGVSPSRADEAEYGDIVAYFVPEQEKYGLGVCMGARAYFITDFGRYLKVPLRKCQYSWRIV